MVSAILCAVTTLGVKNEVQGWNPWAGGLIPHTPRIPQFMGVQGITATACGVSFVTIGVERFQSRFLPPESVLVNQCFDALTSPPSRKIS